jgi:hypothetical protein
MSFDRVLEPSIRSQYLEEPCLLFAHGKEHIDPKQGILQFGPRSFFPEKKHPATVRVGIIGTADTIENARKWIEKSAGGIKGDDEYIDFPGYRKDRGFLSELIFDNDWIAQINRIELDEILRVRFLAQRFNEIVDLLEHKIKLIIGKDRPPDYLIIALPDEIYSSCKMVKFRNRRIGEEGRNLRRALKSVAMKYRIPTQILLSSTVMNNGKEKSRKAIVECQSEIAWNFFTGLYFKSGGYPWGPIGLITGTCYIGVGFYQPLGSILTTMQTSLVQAFDEHGDGLVLRGHEFTWDPQKEGSKSPHLSKEHAFALIELVLRHYKEEMGQTPQRVVVHKTSRYWPQEKEGMTEALKNKVNRYDLIALNVQNEIRLMPENQYPPLRGTYFAVEDIDYLYTTGYIASLRKYYGAHVPAPIQIADHIGYDTPRETLLREILILTKMNWNSSRLGGLLPITLRFSRLIGDIMKEIPSEREPLTNFKFYM